MAGAELETYVDGTQVVTRAICGTPYTVGSMRRDSAELTVRDADVFVMGDDVIVRDAGPEGGHLFAQVVAAAGNVVTLDTPATAGVQRVLVAKLANPGSVTFTARRADETPTEYPNGDPAVTNPSVGVWELRLVNDHADWSVHFQGTTPVHCAGEVTYRVKRSRALGGS